MQIFPVTEVEFWYAPDLNLQFFASCPWVMPWDGVRVQRMGAFVYFWHMSSLYFITDSVWYIARDGNASVCVGCKFGASICLLTDSQDRELWETKEWTLYKYVKVCKTKEWWALYKCVKVCEI